MKLSVALCTYNGAAFIRQQLDSILAQTVPVHEIIICDDGSSDGTVQVIQAYQQQQPGIIAVHRNKENLGVTKNFEKAISITAGEIIFLSDQDDIWAPDKVEVCVSFFEQYPQYYGVCTNAGLLQASGAPSGKRLWELLGIKEIMAKITPGGLYRFMLLYGNVSAGNCLVITQQAKGLIFPFRYIDGMWHDEWIALKLAEKGRLGTLDLDLTCYRMHEGQQTKWLWNDRENKNRVRRSFMEKQPELYPADYYKYWKKKGEHLELLSSHGFSVDDAITKETMLERKRGLLAGVQQHHWAKRKIRLFKLWLGGLEQVSLWEALIS